MLSCIVDTDGGVLQGDPKYTSNGNVYICTDVKQICKMVPCEKPVKRNIAEIFGSILGSSNEPKKDKFRSIILSLCVTTA